MEVICEIRFPVLLRLEAEAPVGLQERIREVYPNYRREDQGLQPPPEMGQLLQNVGITLPTLGLTHRFYDDDESHSVLAATRHQRGDSFIALADKDYQDWDNYSQRLVFAEEQFVAEYQPGNYRRIGLRYRNEISSELLDIPSVDWRDLLTHPISGIVGDPELGTDVIEFKCEATLSISSPLPDARMRVRYGLAANAEKQTVFIVDMDCFVEGKIDREQLWPVLNDFNRQVGDFFRWSISDAVTRALRPRGH
ncbi:MAG: TIGR04255 family protein [Chloroflexi bacterium]|nr:TIGR04255 family protein [Chloroflexota bacterium]